MAVRARHAGATVLGGDCLPSGRGDSLRAVRRSTASPDARLGAGCPRGAARARAGGARRLDPGGRSAPSRTRGRAGAGSQRSGPPVRGAPARAPAAGRRRPDGSDSSRTSNGPTKAREALSHSCRGTSGRRLSWPVLTAPSRGREPAARSRAGWPSSSADPWVERFDLRPHSTTRLATLLGTVTGTSGIERAGRCHRRPFGDPFFVETGDVPPSSAARTNQPFPARLWMCSPRNSPSCPRRLAVFAAAAAAGRRVDDEVLAVVLGTAECDRGSPSAGACAADPGRCPGGGDRGTRVRLPPRVARGAGGERADPRRARPARRPGAAFEAERSGVGRSRRRVAPAELHHWVAAGVRDRAVPALIDAGRGGARLRARRGGSPLSKGALGLARDDPDARAMTGPIGSPC